MATYRSGPADSTDRYLRGERFGMHHFLRMESWRPVFFEPWALGDALIAASVLRTWARRSGRAGVLACASRWHPVITAAMEVEASAEPPPLELWAVDLPYAGPYGRGPLDFDSAAPVKAPPHAGAAEQELRVLSIRGDPRDYWAARRLLKGHQVEFSGWSPFLCRRLWLLDTPFREGWLPVRNRYQAWASLVHLQRDGLGVGLPAPRTVAGSRAVLHVGAQWRSKQYPWPAALHRCLVDAGLEARLVAGPGDPLPDGVEEAAVARLADRALVHRLSEADLVIVNDSGPMHLAAFLGRPTVVLALVANIDEWLPPGVSAVRGAGMPRGYGTMRHYATHRILPGWPSPQDVVSALGMPPAKRAVP